MRVLHVENVAGVAWQIAQGQRSAGIEAHVLVTSRNANRYPCDLTNLYGGGKLRTLWRMLRTLWIARRYDVVHVHGGVRRGRLDVLLIRLLLRKTLVVHYHGSETRLGYGLAWRRLPHAKVVATPDLLERHPDAAFVPNPFTPLPYSFDPSPPLRVVHLPTNRRMKGTDRIERAVQALRAQGVTLDFHVVEGVPHEEALRAMARAHVVIDQLPDPGTAGAPQGLFGMVSLEAMALGRVVLCGLRPDITRFYPACQVVGVKGEEDLAAALRHFAENPARAQLKGAYSRGYVEVVHAPEEVARVHLAIYREARARRRLAPRESVHGMRKRAGRDSNPRPTG